MFSLPPFVWGLSAALLVGCSGCCGLFCVGAVVLGRVSGSAKRMCCVGFGGGVWSGGCCCGSLLLEDCGGCLGCAGGRFRGSGGSPCGLAGGFLGLALWSWAWRMVRAVEGARVTTVISHPWGWSCNSKASPSTVNRELGSRSSRAGASVMVKSHVSGASRGASRPRIPRLKIGAVARGPACPTRTVRRGGSPG